MRHLLQLSLLLCITACGASLFGYEVKETSLREVKKTARSLDDIRDIYREIRRVSNQSRKEHSHATLHIKKNRHKSFLPFDDNRTCRDIPGFYISASDVSAPEASYIMAQAPIKSTVADFFRAMIERKSPLVITLVMPEENGSDKCYPFWQSKLFPMKINNWTIDRIEQGKTVAQSINQSDHRIVQRIFKCTNNTTGDVHHITQLHYENWPDNGVPEYKLFLDLLDNVEQMGLSRYSPITVHCSAGIGRTGTFVAAHSIRKQVAAAKDPKKYRVNIPKEIIRLRKQRHSLIATSKQLQMVYMAIAEKAQ